MDDKNNTTQISALVPTKAHQKVAKFARENRMSMANLVRDALAEYLTDRGMETTFDELSPGEWGGYRGDTDPAILGSGVRASALARNR